MKKSVKIEEKYGENVLLSTFSRYFKISTVGVNKYE